VFERNWGKDHEDIANNPVGDNHDKNRKKNANMLSHPQDKPLMAINWKIGKKSNFKLLLFERNEAKDHEDIAKYPAVSNQYEIE